MCEGWDLVRFSYLAAEIVLEITRKRRGVIFHKDQELVVPFWKGKATYIADRLDRPGLFWGVGDTFKEAARHVGRYVPKAREWAEAVPDDF